MGPSLPDDQAILHQAAERARRLLENLVRDRAPLGGGGGAAFAADRSVRSGPTRPHDPSADFPSPGLLAEGEAVLRRATDSARRLADDLGAAADGPHHPGPPAGA